MNPDFHALYEMCNFHQQNFFEHRNQIQLDSSKVDE